jgi:hypothetical protein
LSRRHVTSAVEMGLNRGYFNFVKLVSATWEHDHWSRDNSCSQLLEKAPRREATYISYMGPPHLKSCVRNDEEKTHL